MKLNRIIYLWLLLTGLFSATTTLGQEKKLPKVEIFAGMDLHYRDIFYTKMYEVLLNLTPSVKWHIGRHWQLAGQAIIPIYNDYGDRYKKVIIEATEFTAYGLFLGVSFSASNGSEAISFEQDKWDNLYGAKDMAVGNANYTYKAGTEITTKATSVLTALLIEKLAQRFGASVSTVNGSYPLNVTLPIGTILTINGTQNKQNVTVSAKGKSVSGTHYGTVSVVVTTSNRKHNGGTN